MDNEAPKYADWVPEAGGYVANGKVVSKSPLYDEGGKLRLSVDPAVFGSVQSRKITAPVTQSQSTLVLENMPHVVYDPGNNGVTTANIAGSGKDANAAATSIGSNGSLNLNTANTDNSAISSPATKSNVTGDIVLNPVDKANQDYQDAIGRNDLQGAINALTELGRLTGQDYSTQIDGLRKQREQKIMGVDDQFIAQYQQAKDAYEQAVRNGDKQTAMQAATAMQQALNQQDAWRGQVGYQDAVSDATARAEQEIEIDYQTTFMDGARDMVNSIIQLTNSYLNFQYDPAQDQNLQRAQSLIEMRMRDAGAATGMYYSSTTQYAIAQAISELVPIYEKMAKDEIRENIALLQNTASFLMDMEQTQFNMWRQRIQLQLDMQAEKRAQWKQALDASNARGYVNNEEAAILGVEPGSMSQQAREHAQALQEQIDKEERELQQSMILAGYKNTLDMQKIEREYALRDWENARQAERQAERDYANNVWDYMIAASKGSGSTVSAPTYEVEYTDENGRTIKQKLTATQDAMGNWVDNQGNIIQPANGMVGSEGSAVWNNVASKYGAETSKLLQNLYGDVYGVKNIDFSDASAVSNFSKGFNSDVTKQLSKEKTAGINALKDYINPNSPNSSNNLVGPTASVKVDTLPLLESTYLQKAKDVVEEAASSFGSSEANTQEAIGKATQSITNMLRDLNSKGMSQKEITKNAELMLLELFEAIENSGSDFDFDRNVGAMQNWANNGVVNISGVAEGLDASLAVFNQGDKAKEDAMVAIIYDVVNAKNVPQAMKKELATTLSQRAYEFANKEGVNGYTGLKKKGYWNYLKQ